MIKVRVTEKIVVLKYIHEEVRKFQRPCWNKQGLNSRILRQRDRQVEQKDYGNIERERLQQSVKTFFSS